MSHKLYVFYGLIVLTVTFGYVVYQGWKYRNSQDPENRYTTGKDELQLTHHHDATNLALFYVPLGILLIEVGVQLRPEGSITSSIFWVHLPLAVAFFLLLLVLRFWLTGLRSIHHGSLGRLCAAFFAGTLGTGSIMLVQM